MGAAGIITSAICIGGSPDTVNVETWNGSSWTEVANLNTARSALAGSGVDNTAALGFGGQGPSGFSFSSN